MKQPKSKAKIIFEGLLDEVIDSVKTAKTFVGEQAPIIAKEIIAEETVKLTYERLINGIAAVLGLIIFFGSITVAASLINSTFSREMSTFLGALSLAGIIAGFVVSAGFIGSFLQSCKELKMLEVAPKKAVLEYLQNHLRRF